MTPDMQARIEALRARKAERARERAELNEARQYGLQARKEAKLRRTAS